MSLLGEIVIRPGNGESGWWRLDLNRLETKEEPSQKHSEDFVWIIQRLLLTAEYIENEKKSLQETLLLLTWHSAALQSKM